MHFAQIRHYDVANGPGIRVTLFVTGCTLGCKNCFNPEYQDFNFGKVFDDDRIDEIVGYLSETSIRGLTLLGGEPMDNAVDLADAVRKIKSRVDKEIWVYSGYTFEQILKDEKKLELLKLCDVLVDGRYVDELRDIRLRFKGSGNQRIIDIKRSLAEGKVVECDY